MSKDCVFVGVLGDQLIFASAAIYGASFAFIGIVWWFMKQIEEEGLAFEPGIMH